MRKSRSILRLSAVRPTQKLFRCGRFVADRSHFNPCFLFLHNSDKAFSIEDVWDGANVNSGYDSKWVASKLLKASRHVSGWPFSGMKMR